MSTGVIKGRKAIVAELQRRLMNRAPRYPDHDFLKPLPWVICADGFYMSVQAGFGCYCKPETSTGPWEEVEVGYPSGPARSLEPYESGGVYPHVSIQRVGAIISAHGGLMPQRDGFYGKKP